MHILLWCAMTNAVFSCFETSRRALDKYEWLWDYSSTLYTTDTVSPARVRGLDSHESPVFSSVESSLREWSNILRRLRKISAHERHVIPEEVMPLCCVTNVISTSQLGFLTGMLTKALYLYLWVTQFKTMGEHRKISRGGGQNHTLLARRTKNRPFFSAPKAQTKCFAFFRDVLD